jgi:hypothetical protein
MNWTSNEQKDRVTARLKAKLRLSHLDAEERTLLVELLQNAAHSAPAAQGNIFAVLRDLGLLPQGET